MEVAKGTDDGIQLMVKNVVIDLSGLERGREETNRVFNTIVITLHQGRADGESRGISVEDKGMIVIDRREDRFRGESVFQALEGSVSFGCPDEGYALLGEVVQRMGEFGIIADEWLIEISKAKEGADFGDGRWCRPFKDTLKFHRVHGNAV